MWIWTEISAAKRKAYLQDDEDEIEGETNSRNTRPENATDAEVSSLLVQQSPDFVVSSAPD